MKTQSISADGSATNTGTKIIPSATQPAESSPQAPTRAELLADLGLPADTSDKELSVILTTNVGTLLPFKAAVHTALVTHVQLDKKVPQHKALEYVSKKFPMIKPPSTHGVSDAAELLREQLIKIYGLTEDATEQEIAEAATAAQNQNTAEKAKRAQEEADEMLIAEKVSRGITRAQAISVIKRQREHDAAVKRQIADRRPRLLEIIKAHPNNIGMARRAARDELGIFEGSEFNAALAELKAA